MPRAGNDGIEIEYDTIGDPHDEPLLLVMGFTAQMIAWEEKFCRAIADKGHFVIRYDNRDCGLSSHLDGVAVDMAAIFTARTGGGELPAVPYTLSEMASDGMAVLDALEIDQAHVVGASMGGMIVQTMAIEHPHRLRTVTSIMSMTGEPEYGQASPDAMAALMRPPPAGRSEAIDASVVASKIFSSPRYFDETRTRERAAASYDRAFYPEGAMRQMAAIVASGDRADGLREVSLPFLVMHGRADTLIGLSGGERTAELVKGANLVVLNDMGHDLPEPLWPFIVDTIASHATHAIG
ncbi:MAG TPA: alpha/beta hydrolase [Acidimicrobiales bacterium]|nr:alpha/beta hydrolase [Acidimicrobiales bacterium]